MSSTLTTPDILSTKVQHTHSHTQILKQGLPPVAAVASLSTLSLVPMLGFLTVPALFLSLPILVFGHAIMLRTHLVEPSLKHCDGSRRFVTRWSLRLLYWIAAIWGYVLSAFTPFWSILIVPAVFAGLTFVSYKYTHWQLEQSAKKAPIHILEQFFLAMMVLGFIGSIGLAVFLVAIFGGMAAVIAALSGAV